MENNKEFWKERMDSYDREMFSKSQYVDMKFTRENEWGELDGMWRNGYEYVSPVFRFENGDRIAVNRTGELVKLN